MQTTSRAACGDSTDPKDCPVLENVFQYMGGNFGSAVACGVKMGAYVSRKMKHNGMLFGGGVAFG